MSRKNLLSSLQNGAKSDAQVPPPHNRPHMNAANSKPMAAVTKSLGVLNDRNRRAEEIESSLKAGQAIVEVDAAFIDPSFVQDRMGGDIDGLRESIRQQGQQVPILVRLHPQEPGRYQVAFGHRRLRALRELGLPVKAVVRELSDEQLVIAQGQENNEREDLTFIEKARFAQRLSKRFSRDVITSSMSLHKSDLSKMLLIVEAVPAELIDSIGSAPGVGIGSWRQMADLLEQASDPAGIVEYAKSQQVQALPSVERFKSILAMKSRRPARALPDVMSSSAGERLAQIAQNKVKLEITIDKRATPGFAAFVLEQLPTLYAEHLAKQELKTGE